MQDLTIQTQRLNWLKGSSCAIIFKVFKIIFNKFFLKIDNIWAKILDPDPISMYVFGSTPKQLIVTQGGSVLVDYKKNIPVK